MSVMSKSSPYVVGITSDFLADDAVAGGPIKLRFPSVDLAPLQENPNVTLKVVNVSIIEPGATKYGANACVCVCVCVMVVRR